MASRSHQLLQQPLISVSIILLVLGGITAFDLLMYISESRKPSERVTFLVGVNYDECYADREQLAAASTVIAKNFGAKGIWAGKSRIRIEDATFEAFKTFLQLFSTKVEIGQELIPYVYALVVKYGYKTAIEYFDAQLLHRLDELTESQFLNIVPWILEADNWLPANRGLLFCVETYIKKHITDILKAKELLESNRNVFVLVLEHTPRSALESADILFDASLEWAIKHCTGDECDPSNHEQLRKQFDDPLVAKIPFCLLSKEKIKEISVNYIGLFAGQNLVAIRAMITPINHRILFESEKKVSAYKLFEFSNAFSFSQDVFLKKIIASSLISNKSDFCPKYTFTIWKKCGENSSPDKMIYEETLGVSTDDIKKIAPIKPGVRLCSGIVYIISVSSAYGSTRSRYLIRPIELLSNRGEPDVKMEVIDPKSLKPIDSAVTAFESMFLTVIPPTTDTS